MQSSKNPEIIIWTKNDINFNYDKKFEILVLDPRHCDNISKQDVNFSSKYWQNVFELEKLHNGKYEVSINIDSSVDLIQWYASQNCLFDSSMSKERWYGMSPEERIIWDKLSESDQASGFSNIKTPHNPSDNTYFHFVTLGDPNIPIYHQSDFGDINYDSSNVDSTHKDTSTNGDINGAVVLNNVVHCLSWNIGNVQYSSHQYYIQQLNYITSDVNIYSLFINLFTYVYIYNHSD